MDDAFQASKHERRMGDETEGMGNRTAVWTKANTRTPRARYLTETLLLLRRSGSERVRGKGSDPSITTAMNIRKRPKKGQFSQGLPDLRKTQRTKSRLSPKRHQTCSLRPFCKSRQSSPISQSGPSAAAVVLLPFQILLWQPKSGSSSISSR